MTTRTLVVLLYALDLAGIAVAQRSGRCNRGALTEAWSSQGRTYVTAPSGAQDCSTVGDGTCHAIQILDYTACEIAQDACFNASVAQADSDGYCPWSARCLSSFKRLPSLELCSAMPELASAHICSCMIVPGRVCRDDWSHRRTRNLGRSSWLPCAGWCTLAIQRKRRSGERMGALAHLLARRKRRPRP